MSASSDDIPAGVHTAAPGVDIAALQKALGALGGLHDETTVAELPANKRDEALAVLEREGGKLKEVLNAILEMNDAATEEFLRDLMELTLTKTDMLQAAAEAANAKSKYLLPESEAGPPELDPSMLEYNEARDFLGQGSFGKVYSGLLAGKRVAIKVPLKQELSPAELDDFRREVTIMKKIFHPNCVLFLGCCSQPGSLRIVTELVFTDLEKLLKSRQTLTLTQRMKMALDGSIGMQWIHQGLKIVHHDLKPANLLVDDNFNVKITDYGFSQLKKDDEEVMQNEGVAKGTPLWMSPEIMMGRPFTDKCDVYAYGIILWQILTRDDPFKQHTDFRRFRLAVCRRNERPPIPDTCPKSLSSLIQRCWAANDAERPTFAEISLALHHISLETMVPAEGPRLFWTQHFLKPRSELETVVPWSDFVQKLYLAVSPKDKPVNFHKSTFDKLKKILSRTNKVDKYMVEVTRFAALCTWFGDIFQPGEDGLRVLEDIRTAVDKPWFHEEISKEEAEHRLQSQEPGTFLVRISTSAVDFPFAISTTGNQHRRVYHPPGGKYSFKGHPHEYDSLVDIIENCQEPKIKATMQVACPLNVDSSLWGYA